MPGCGCKVQVNKALLKVIREKNQPNRLKKNEKWKNDMDVQKIFRELRRINVKK